MKYLFFAMYPEARPYIGRLGLKKDPSFTKFQVFAGGGILLVVTGVGPVKAVFAAASLLALYPPGKGDLLVNIGSCALDGGCSLRTEGVERADGRRGRIFLVSCLTDAGTGKSYYPDILYDSPFPEARLCTRARPYLGVEKKGPGRDGLVLLYDMEGAALFQAGSRYFTADRMLFLKIVSDSGAKNLIPGSISRVMQESVEPVCAFLARLQRQEEAGKGDACLDQPDRLAGEAAALFCASANMEQTLRQDLRYAGAAGIDAAGILDGMRQQGRLPAADRRQGKKLLADFTKKLLLVPGRPGASIREPVKAFRRIYVESRVWDHPRTRAVLAHFPGVQVMQIGHYKDIFNRPNQDPSRQHRDLALILAADEGELVYPGAPVCQNFGNQNFYYTSSTMNCVFDCEYCFLKGMYPSGHMVVFVNLEDYFQKVRALTAKGPAYLSVSYEGDLAAADAFTDACSSWLEFSASCPDLTIEVRTKSASAQMWERLPQSPAAVFAFTLSPDEIIRRYEHGTPPLAARIACAAEGIRAGRRVRLCFDPMLVCPDWKETYGQLLEQTVREIDLTAVEDFSIGTFRISAGYLKNLRRVLPCSAAAQYPYTNVGGYYQYDPRLAGEMENFMKEKLSAYVPENRIFLFC